MLAPLLIVEWVIEVSSNSNCLRTPSPLLRGAVPPSLNASADPKQIEKKRKINMMINWQKASMTTDRQLEREHLEMRSK